jgi:hypothetical protein
MPIFFTFGVSSFYRWEYQGMASYPKRPKKKKKTQTF